VFSVGDIRKQGEPPVTDGGQHETCACGGDLWFIGVLRDRIGPGEDRFFATVFLGGGLVIVATFFAAEAVAAGLIDTAAVRGPDSCPGSSSSHWSIWAGIVSDAATISAQIAVCDRSRPDGDAGRGASHRGPLQELFDRRDVGAGEARRPLADALRGRRWL
jgi:hypothetical protein